MSKISKIINGVRISFTVKLNPRYKADKGKVFWQKIIDVTDGVGFGPAPNWAEALEFARELAGNTNQWHLDRRAKRSL